MNTKLTLVVYPAVAVLSLAAAFAAHAQSADFAADRAGYGATVVNTTSNVSRADVRSQAIAARDATMATFKDKSGYGPMLPVNTPSLRTRAEVRAEAIAAREDGYDLQWREGGDIQYAAMQRAKAADTAHVMAAVPAKTAAQ